MSYYSEEEALQQRPQKQQYLKTEIIEKGYDGGAFAEYLSSVKPDGGANVDVWSLDELKELVNKFKAWTLQEANEAPPEDHFVNNTLNETQFIPQFDSPFDTHVSYNDPQQQNITDSKFHMQRDLAQKQNTNVLPPEESKQGGWETYNEANEQQQTVPNQNLNSSKIPQDLKASEQKGISKEKEEYYSSKLNVKLAESTQLRDVTNAEILVHGYDQTKSGLFSITHTNYLVKTNPFGWDVKRRYSDFFWLRTTLQRLHPGHMVPPIPQKKNKNKSKPDFLRKRMYFLQRFLNACALNPELRSDKYFFAFLNQTNDTQYKNIKKEADKKQKYHRIKDIPTLSGQVPIEINKELKLHAQSIGDLCIQSEPIYAKLRKLGKQLIADFDQVSNTLYQVAECYAGLYSAATNFNKNTEAGKNLHLEDIYLTMNNIMVSWAQQMTQQNENIQRHFTYFYKYAEYENEAFKEVIEIRTKTGLEYLQRKKDLFAKKERLFQQKDVSRWELSSKAKDIPKDDLLKDKQLAFDMMLSKETAALHELRTSFGYYNAMSFSELDQALREKCRQYAKNFHEFGIEQADIMNQVQTKWAEFLVHFMDSNVPVGNTQREILSKNTVQNQKSDQNAAQFDDD